MADTRIIEPLSKERDEALLKEEIKGLRPTHFQSIDDAIDLLEHTFGRLTKTEEREVRKNLKGLPEFAKDDFVALEHESREQEDLRTRLSHAMGTDEGNIAPQEGSGELMDFIQAQEEIREDLQEIDKQRAEEQLQRVQEWHFLNSQRNNR